MSNSKKHQIWCEIGVDKFIIENNKDLTTADKVFICTLQAANLSKCGSQNRRQPVFNPKLVSKRHTYQRLSSFTFDAGI